MVFTKSYGASGLFTVEPSMVSDPLSKVHFAPTISNNFIIVRVSLRSGTRLILLLPSAIIAAVIMGSTAFFAPLIFTDPDNGFCPCIISLSIMHLPDLHLRRDLE